MIDHLFRFASETEAKADPVIGAFWREDENGGTWDAACCIPGLLVWQPASDTVTTVSGLDGDTTLVEHHPVPDADGTPYWYILIARPAVDLDLFNAAILTTDRDAANAGLPFVLGSVLSGTELATYMLQPSFAGSQYPFGNPV